MKKIISAVLLLWLVSFARAADCQTLQGDQQKNCIQTSIDSYALSEADHTFADIIVSKISSKTDTAKQTFIALVRTIEQSPKLTFNYRTRAILQSVADIFQAEWLALCLTQKGVIMYGTERCPHCQNQKKLFGDAFASIHYVDCDLSPTQCQAANITGYPTRVGMWINSPGQQALSEIAKTFACNY